MSRDCLSGIDAVVIAGGLGTRLQGALGRIPKVLAPINGRPFLDHLLDRLRSFGTRRVVLCLGHLAEEVTAYLGDNIFGDMTVETVIEFEPLGTAGALRLARPLLHSEPVLIMNGDTWLESDICGFVEFHRTRKTDISIHCVEVPDVSRFGSVKTGTDGHVLEFIEKDPEITGPGTVSAGTYLFNVNALNKLAASEGTSLERDFLPKQPAGSVHGFVDASARFIDIGTLESLALAGEIIPALEDKAVMGGNRGK